MRTNPVTIACCTLVACIARAEQAARPAVELVLDGRATAVIVVPDNPLPVVKAAAEELRYHIERVSGERRRVGVVAWLRENPVSWNTLAVWGIYSLVPRNPPRFWRLL
jgi:hypothetical protein